MNNDDQDWLDVLSGQRSGASETATGKQAEALRRAIRDEQLDAPESLDPVSVRRMRNQLIGRMRREGLLDSSPGYFDKRVVALAGVAAIVLVAFLGYRHMAGYVPPVPGMSEDFPIQLVTRADLEVQRLLVDSPERTAAMLVRECGALGLPWRLSKVGDDWLLEVYVGLQPSGETLAWMNEGGYAARESGWVQLLIVQSDR